MIGRRNLLFWHGSAHRTCDFKGPEDLPFLTKIVNITLTGLRNTLKNKWFFMW